MNEVCGYVKDVHGATVELEWPRRGPSVPGHDRPNVFACESHAREYEAFGYRRVGKKPAR